MVHCRVLRSFANKNVTSLGLLHDVLPLDFPLLCPLLLPQSHVPSVLRHCEILTETSSFSLPKARRICCAAGGAAPFQELSKKIFAKFLGNKGWMLRDCSSHATFKHISEFPCALQNQQRTTLLPTLPHSRPWRSSGMRLPVLEWPEIRISKTTFGLCLLLCRHKEIQIPLPQVAHLSWPGVSTGAVLLSALAAQRTQQVCRLRGRRHSCGGNWYLYKEIDEISHACSSVSTNWNLFGQLLKE